MKISKEGPALILKISKAGAVGLFDTVEEVRSA